ncbi:cytochrome P460 family protein [Methanococcoides alaskense]|uniref:Cytochrome P460 domain-containing protein n=1 Tax=Methanococcoides alaskense TaxID=325778 RepID=A0AA90TXJ9_9EURY|nr:cytochrome P460 family protein [Methanococcoides alaskense]MDA0525291.1 cytochrome P460 family protein [Methanococcoides alaskense]MDR6221785.1 hypothetical protein [Methanococcoides alaskense]
MRKELTILLILISAFMVIGCTGYDSGDQEPVPENGGEAQPNAAELYEQITQEDNYKEWGIWPGFVELSEGKDIHGELITIYVSDNAFTAIEDKEDVMPDGSIIVKEGYNPDEELERVLVMYKVKDYDPENNDWFWALYSPQGEVTTEGKVAGCIDCHSANEDNDYLFTGDLS